MSISANRKGIIAFLTKVKTALEKGSFLLVEREKNMQGLASLGYTIDDAKTVLFDLTVNDYVSGPEPDNNPKYEGDVWLFGTTVENLNLYIMLKLRDCGQVVCISFHEAQWPLKHPFKD